MSMLNERKTSNSWKRVASFLVPLLLFLLVAHSLLVAMACGVVFAVAAEPAAQRFNRALGKARGLAPAFVMFLGGLFVAAPIATCVAFGRADVAELGAKIADLNSQTTLSGVSAETSKAIAKLGIELSPGEILRRMNSALSSAGEWLGDVARATVAGTADALLSLFVFLLVFYSWMRDHGRLEALGTRLSPFTPGQSRRLLNVMRDAAVDAVLSAGAIGLVQAAIMLAFMLAVGLPGAWLLAIVTFFCSFLPVIGTLPVSGFATLYLFVEHRPVEAGIMLAGGIMVAVCDNLLRLIIKPRGDVPPIVNLVAILGGLELLGFGGLFLGPIIAAIATWSLQELVRQRKPLVQSADVLTANEVHHTAS